MLKKTLAAFAALIIGLGIAILAVAAPASAHHNTISVKTVECTTDSTYKVTWTVTNSEKDKTEEILRSSDTALVPVGTIIQKGASATFVEYFTSAITADKKLTLYSRWSNGVEHEDTGTLSKKQFPASCSPSKSVTVTCDAVDSFKGSPLIAGDVVTVSATVGGSVKNVQATVVTGTAGYNGLGLQTPSGTTALSQSDVLGGHLNFAYASAFGLKHFTDVSVSAPGGVTKSGPTECGEVTPVEIITIPSSTSPTCDAPGALVIPTQTGVVFTGGSNGDGPTGTEPVTYHIVATPASSDYRLVGDTTWDITVQPKKSGFNCETSVQPVAPKVTTIQACDTVGAVVPETTTGVDYALTWTAGTPGVGAWTVVATPQAGFHFGTKPTDPQSVTFTGDVGPTTTCVTAKEPKGEPQVCDTVNGGTTGGDILVTVVPNLTYYIDGVKVENPSDPTVTTVTVAATTGDHIVTVVPDAGYVVVGDDTFTVTVAPAIDCATGVVLADPPVASPETCDTTDGSVVNGAIVIPHTRYVSYEIDGAPVDTAAEGNHTFSLPAGTYTITAIPDADHLIVGDAVFEVTVDEPAFECQIALDFVPSGASSNQSTCTATGDFQSGSITVEMAAGVAYEIDGEPVTTSTTTVAAGTHEVQAYPLPGYGLTGDSEWELTIDPGSAAGCGGTGLAFTGSAATGGLVAAAGILLGLGGALLVLRRRAELKAAAATDADS